MGPTRLHEHSFEEKRDPTFSMRRDETDASRSLTTRRTTGNGSKTASTRQRRGNKRSANPDSSCLKSASKLDSRRPYCTRGPSPRRDGEIGNVLCPDSLLCSRRRQSPSAMLRRDSLFDESLLESGRRRIKVGSSGRPPASRLTLGGSRMRRACRARWVSSARAQSKHLRMNRRPIL